MTDRSLPLAGITVLDLADEATVFGARLLAELGARVIRIEDESGDAIRRRAPFLRAGKHAAEPDEARRFPLERSLAHLWYNAGKHSVALDLTTDESWETIERLALACDIVVGPCTPNPRVRTLFDRLENTADAPGIVETVFRRDAPDEVATDLIATAAGGLLVLGGYSEDPPNHPKGELAFKQCGLAAAHGSSVPKALQDRIQAGGRLWPQPVLGTPAA